MPAAKLDATIKAANHGITKLSPDQAVKNIEGWEEYLGKHEAPGVKSVVTDLGKLKTLLQSDKLDTSAIEKLVKKLGHDTEKVKGEGPNAAKIKELGEALAK